MPEPLLQRYPELSQLDPQGQQLITQAQHLRIPANAVIFRQGDLCNNFILVTSGTVKVLARGTNGRELVLYRIEDKGSCVLTTSCLLGRQIYPAEGIAETDVEAFLLPAEAFEKALAQSPILRQFIFSSYAHPLSDMIELVQSIAFESIESRLVEYLLAHNDERLEINCSHQTIADELGTAREVISRQLKKLEQQQLVQLERGRIRICDLEQLNSVT